jgi:aconitate hydratase
MSPPLVVAFALAGRIDVDMRKDPIVREMMASGLPGGSLAFARGSGADHQKSIDSKMFRKSYGEVFAGDEHWRSLAIPQGETYAWEKDSTYIRRAPYFDDMRLAAADVDDITAPRVLAVLGDSVTTRPHLSRWINQEG